ATLFPAPPLRTRPEGRYRLPEEHQRCTKRESPIVLPERAGLVTGHGSSPAGGNHVVRGRVLQLVEVVVPVRSQLKSPTRDVPEPTAKSKRKRGAESVGI